MKNPLPFLLVCLTLPLSGLLAAPQEESKPDREAISKSFWYVDMGLGPMPAFVPSFGLGCRGQRDHHGVDFSVQASTVIYYTQAKASLLYHYFSKPNVTSQFYGGFGLGVSGLFKDKKSVHKATLCLSPELVFGKEYLNESKDRRFFQVQISVPTYSFKHFWTRRFTKNPHILYMPAVVISYGLGF